MPTPTPTNDPPGVSRRQFLAWLTISGGAATLGGCGWDGHFSVLGYSTRPNFPSNIKTIYIPQFRLKAMLTTPHRGLEIELTRAVIREIESKCPCKVLSDPEKADSELLGTVKSWTKIVQTRNQQNEQREDKFILTVEVVWRDLTTGKILTNPPPSSVRPPKDPFDPDNPLTPEGPDTAIPFVITATSRALNDVGESNASAQTAACKQMAQQIVEMMESPWLLPQKACPPGAPAGPVPPAGP